MLFNSFEFLIFYVAVVVLFFSVHDRYRWVLLLGASYWFYMSWRVEYVLLIMATTLINYGVAIAIEKSRSDKLRTALLVLGVGASLSLLLTYKYANFVSENVEQALAAITITWDVPYLDLILPLGISFYTFQAIGYVIDVYRGETKAERHLGIFALYVSFFPQLVAGPIERSHRLLPQFRRTQSFETTRLVSGLGLILWGLFKKVVVADNIAAVVDTVYENPDAFSGPFLILATFFFAIQIYCDFSGYSDMAVGTARILGYNLMVNFERPYFARSVAQFWRRWHISLSTWFRDYVYRPLGGNRVSRLVWVRNITVVFLLSGIWHGANWTFVVWGLIHGLALVAGALTVELRVWFSDAIGLSRLPKVHALVQTLVVTVIVLIAWVFFRAQSIGEAMSIIGGFTDFTDVRVDMLWQMGLTRFEMAVATASIFALFLIEAIQEFERTPATKLWSMQTVRWTSYAMAFYAIVFFGLFGQKEFIYFQF